MKYLFNALLLLMTPVLASAEIDTRDIAEFNNLTEAQKLQIAQQINELSTENGVVNTVADNMPLVTPEKVDEWVVLGEKFGMMLGGAAKELGIAANEFATSPLGMVTMGVIIWNYAGDDLYGFILGMLWLGIMIPVWTFLFFKIAYPVESYADVKKKRLFNDPVTVSKPVRAFTRSKLDDYAYPAITFMIAGGFILLVGIVFLA